MADDLKLGALLFVFILVIASVYVLIFVVAIAAAIWNGPRQIWRRIREFFR